MIRLVRWVAVGVSLALAGWWLARALLGRAWPRELVDPVTGLRLRVAPLSRAEREAARALERDLLAACERTSADPA